MSLRILTLGLVPLAMMIGPVLADDPPATSAT